MAGVWLQHGRGAAVRVVQFALPCCPMLVARLLLHSGRIYNGCVAKKADPTASTPPAAGAAAPFRSGFVAIVGRPNVGKSTLLNRLVGGKISIVSPHPQTTRTWLSGIAHLAPTAGSAGGQIVFVDTPGVHAGGGLHGRELLRSVHTGLEGRDLALLVADVSRAYGREDQMALELLRPAGPDAAALPAVFLLLNKIDLLSAKPRLLELIDAWRRRFDFAEIFPVSARTGEGLDPLLPAILGRLPPGPEYFPAGQRTDQSQRFQLSEIIREAALLRVRAEVPHALAVRVESFEELPRLARIAAIIYCERESQRPILLGRGGAGIREIGTAARRELEALLGRKVFLGLHVLVRPAWREDRRFLADLDWRREGE